MSVSCLHHLHPSFPTLPPPSDIMGQSKVTHIYPIKRDFEKTDIGLQLMLRWGPESERCSRLKRLGFQSPANKRQSSPRRERRRQSGLGGGEGGSMWRVSPHCETVACEERLFSRYNVFRLEHRFMTEGGVERCFCTCTRFMLMHVCVVRGFQEPGLSFSSACTRTCLGFTGRCGYRRCVNGAELN